MQVVDLGSWEWVYSLLWKGYRRLCMAMHTVTLPETMARAPAHFSVQTCGSMRFQQDKTKSACLERDASSWQRVRSHKHLCVAR